MARRSGQVFFVAALIAMLVAIGFATTSSTHVLERATLLQREHSGPVVVEQDAVPSGAPGEGVGEQLPSPETTV